MIPGLEEIAWPPGVTASFFALVIAGLLMGLVLVTQSIARWFEDWES